MTEAAGPGDSLLSRLEALVPGASRRTLRQMIEHGRVLVNGRAARRAADRVPAGAEVRILPRKIEGAAPPALVRIVHEDAHLVVVDKPAGLPTVSARSAARASVWSALRRILRDRKPAGEAHLVHRLDEATSGLLVFAKTPRVQEALKGLFEKHGVERRYAAVVAGTMRRPQGELRSLLVELDDRMHRVRSLRRGDPAKLRAAAREAVTRWRSLGASEGATAIEATLETGRKHQVRVHLAEAGHPVLGDRLYGGPSADRLYLHAWVLGFDHPVARRRLRLVSPPGPAFDARVPGAFRRPA